MARKLNAERLVNEAKLVTLLSTVESGYRAIGTISMGIIIVDLIIVGTLLLIKEFNLLLIGVCLIPLVVLIPVVLGNFNRLKKISKTLAIYRKELAKVINEVNKGKYPDIREDIVNGTCAAYMNLKGFVIEGIEIKKPLNFRGSNLTNAKFVNASLKQSKFDKANLTNVEARGTDFTLASFKEARIKDSIFEKCIFKKAQFENNAMENATFKESDFAGCDLSAADYTGATFENCTSLKGKN